MQHAKTLALCVVLVIAAFLVGRSTLDAQQPVPTLDRMFTPGSVFADARTPISSLPFTINQCGSYFLTACLTGAAGQNGITIEADNVTVDLNGFTLIGVPGSLNGVLAPLPQKNMTIFGGTIQGWGTNGVSAATSDDWTLRDLRILGNGVSDSGSGALLAQRAKVVDCTIEQNNGSGLETGDGAIVDRCQVLNNTGGNAGIVLKKTCMIFNCYVSGNSERQIILDGFGSLAHDNFIGASGVGSVGIELTNQGDTCVVRENLLAPGTGGTTGISADSNESHLIGNTIRADTAISLTAGSFGNLVVHNWTTSSLTGIANGNPANIIGTTPATADNHWGNF